MPNLEKTAEKQTTTASANHAQPVQLPLVDSTTWGRELIQKFESGVSHAFILHGNVEDYVGGEVGEQIVAALIKRFARNRDVAVSFDRANGFYFPSAEHKANFKVASGIEEELAALRGNITGPSGGLAGAFNTMSASTRASTAESDTAVDKIASAPAAAISRLAKLLRYVPPAVPLNPTPTPAPTTGTPVANAKAAAKNNKPADAQPGNSSSSPRSFRSAVIINYAETIAPAGGTGGVNASETDRNCLVTLQEIGKDLSIAAKGNIVILIVSDLSSLHEQLRRSGSRWEQIEIPFPTTEERMAFADQILADPVCAVSLEADLAVGEVARLTTGLRYIDVDDILLRAEYEGDTLTREHVRNRKREIVSAEYDDVLQIVDENFGFEVLGGMDEIKRVLLNDVVEPMRSGDYHLVPQGALLMGPPGTGKSRIARALAKEAGFTFVELQPSKIFDKWIGSTEQRLARAMRAIKSITPVLVFMDEIDQIGTRGESGDSGVGGRVFKQLLETMADTTLRGRVFWFGATNKPENLDAALLRPGRLDLKIPVLVPNASERASILEVLATKVFGAVAVGNANKQAEFGLPTAEEYERLAEQMEGEDYTGAEIEAVVIKASRLWLAANRNWTGQSQLTKTVSQCLQEAYELIIPSTPDVEGMTHQALLHCSDLELVPPQHRERARQIRRRKQKTVADNSAEFTVQEQDTGRRGRRREL